MNIKDGKKFYCLFLVVFLTGCGARSQIDTSQEFVALSEEADKLLYVTEADSRTEFSEPFYINLSEAEDGLIIEKGGDYVLTGEYDQTLNIDVHDQNVHLFFNNVKIQTTIGPAINVRSGSKVIITLMKDSQNAIFDAAYYNDEELSGAISAACDLTINGEGALFVCGYYKDAVYTKDIFKLLGGQVQVKAKRYGIKGSDGMVLNPNTLIIESEKNGCYTSNNNKAGKGIIDIRGGEITIVAGEYGLASVSDVYMHDGEIYINSVIANIYTEGQQYIAEGVFVDE